MKIFKVIIFTSLLVIIFLAYLYIVDNKDSDLSTDTKTISSPVEPIVITSTPPKPEPPKHLATPRPLRALYMSSWTAGSLAARSRIIKIADETEINAVVIDVKDSTGVISFNIDDPLIRKMGVAKDRIPDVDNLIQELHDKDIYLIARVAVFEDPKLVALRPDLAVKKKSTGAVWKDHKGLSWADMGSREVWDYNIAVAKGAYNAGFDEINFDYIRFPSDGDMNDISYPSLEGPDRLSGQETGKKLNRPRELKFFFIYLNEKMKEVGAPISADLFGMTTTNTDDLNIGQVLENAIPYFDYISPMVYPSHYPNNFNGYKNPAEVPYDLIKFVMSEGVKRVTAASSSPDKLRPWLQDFNLGAVYTAPMVRDQIRATYDVGLSSWLLWNPSNRYTVDALEK